MSVALKRNTGQDKNKDTNKAVNQGGAFLDAVSSSIDADIKVLSLSALKEWVETDDLDEGESLAQRLQSFVNGIADEEKDGEITKEDQDVMDTAIQSMMDYCQNQGVPDEDIDSLFNDWNNEAAIRVSDQLVESLPDGDDAVLDGIFDFVWDEYYDDGLTLDVSYKKKKVVRNGKRVVIRKRISGFVKRSAKQKRATEKAARFSQKSGAKRKRAKSMSARKKAGM